MNAGFEKASRVARAYVNRHRWRAATLVTDRISIANARGAWREAEFWREVRDLVWKIDGVEI